MEIENINQEERITSVLVGSWLLYKSQKTFGKHPFLSFQGVTASGLMLYRGVTGVCLIYKQLGMNTTDPWLLTLGKKSLSTH